MCWQTACVSFCSIHAVLMGMESSSFSVFTWHWEAILYIYHLKEKGFDLAHCLVDSVHSQLAMTQLAIPVESRGTKLLSSWRPRIRAGQQCQRQKGKGPYRVPEVMPLLHTQTYLEVCSTILQISKLIKLTVYPNCHHLHYCNLTGENCPSGPVF